MNRCSAAWKLYDDWCDVSDQLKTAKQQEVIQLQTLSTYLECELRSHLRTCRECKSYMLETLEVSNAYQQSGITAVESRDAVDLRPETVRVIG